MWHEVSSARIIETAAVYFVGLAVFLVSLVDALKDTTRGFIRWWAATVAANTAVAIWFVIHQQEKKPVSLPFHLWQGLTALCLLVPEVRLAWKVSTNHNAGRLITVFGVALQFGLAPGGIYLYVNGVSEVLWTLSLPTHVTILLMTCLPLYGKYFGLTKDNNQRMMAFWIGAIYQLAIVLLSIGLLAWEWLCGPSTGQYAGNNALVFAVIVREIKKILFGRKERSISDEEHTMGAHQSTRGSGSRSLVSSSRLGSDGRYASDRSLVAPSAYA